MLRLSVYLFFILLNACAARQTAFLPDCHEAYVILPANYIIDITAGSRVYVNPSVQEFALFCTPQAAREAYQAANPEGDWRIYRLEGEFADLAKPHGKHEYALAESAAVVDWVEMD